jgi:hypothetical protein
MAHIVTIFLKRFVSLHSYKGTLLWHVRLRRMWCIRVSTPGKLKSRCPTIRHVVISPGLRGAGEALFP